MDFERFASPNWLSTTLSASSRSRKPPTKCIDEASKEKLLKSRIETLIPERLREHHIKDRQHFFKKRKTRPMGGGFDLFGRKKDGGEFPVEVSLSHIQSDQEVLAVAFITDCVGAKARGDGLAEEPRKAARADGQIDVGSGRRK